MLGAPRETVVSGVANKETNVGYLRNEIMH